MLEAELFAFLENTADAVFAVRETGEICFWNHAAEALFGHPVDKVMGKTCSNVLHGIGALGTDVCHEGCAALRCAKPASHIPNFDLNVTTQSEERIWVNLSSISFLNRRTGRSLLVHLVRDISAQKKREEVFGRMVAISKEVANLEDAVTGAAPIAPLSSQELEILRMFAVGATAPRIAKALGISPQTLRNHLHHINRKLSTTVVDRRSAESIRAFDSGSTWRETDVVFATRTNAAGVQGRATLAIAMRRADGAVRAR